MVRKDVWYVFYPLTFFKVFCFFFCLSCNLSWGIFHVNLDGLSYATAAAAAKLLQSCPTLRPHRGQPTRLPCPWDSPGKNTGVGCHFLLQCMKVKSESEVAQSCPTLSDLMDYSLPGSSVHGIFQARVLEWGAIAFSGSVLQITIKSSSTNISFKDSVNCFSVWIICPLMKVPTIIVFLSVSPFVAFSICLMCGVLLCWVHVYLQLLYLLLELIPWSLCGVLLCLL